VLTEARTVLPGAQALLGFQFATMLMEGFEKLPESSKYVHLASLAMVALAIVLLMTPAAYHRIVEQGEDTERFHRFSGRVLLASMVPLALGVCGDLFVVIRKVSESSAFAVACALVMILFFYGFWFGYTAYRRSKVRRGREWAADFDGRHAAD
jgi:DMSO reductase anchor subunit